MRILQVINNLQPAGAETLLRDLILGLRARGLSVDLILLQSTGSWIEKEIAAAGIRITSCENRRLYSPLQVLRLMNAVDQRQYDVAHVHLFPSQLWTACAAWAAGWKFPLVTSEHSTSNRRRIQLFRPFDRWMYSNYKAAIGVSEAVSEQLSSWLGSREISVVRNGIDLKRFHVQRSGWLKRELGVDAPLILSVGRFDDLKDHSTAVRALRHLPGVHLALVGDGPIRMEVQRLAEMTNVSSRVHFLGRRDDVPQLIAGSDIYVQCSRREGFGIAALEAMAGGLPVVATNIPGLSEVVGTAGLTFAPGDDKRLAELTREILDDEELSMRLGIASRSRARQFDIENTVDQYCSAYRSAIRGLGPARSDKTVPLQSASVPRGAGR